MGLQDFKYYAFISYKREDEKWAEWLQEKIEFYHLPLKVREKYKGFQRGILDFKDQ